MMSTLLIHVWLNSIVKRSPLSRSTYLDHIWSMFTVWQSPPMRGICSDHIWSKPAVRQSPPTRGTFWTTFGWSPLCDKVLQRGAQYGPHLVEVCCVTKSSNEGHNLGYIWSKSAAWQGPLMRGTIWTTFGQNLLHDKVLKWGAQFGPHLDKVRSETKSSDKGHNFFCHILPLFAVWQLCLMANHGYHSLATFEQSPLCDTSSD